MLFNLKQALFNMDALAGWLERKPADAAYEFSSAQCCLMGQYLEENGWEGERTFYDMPHYLDIAAPEPRTFGGALQRLKACQNLAG